MLQKWMMVFVVATLGLTGAAMADAIDRLVGKTVTIDLNFPCTNSPTATRKTWHVNMENPIYVSTERRLFLFWSDSADKGIGVVSDGRPHSNTTIRLYDREPQSVPITVRSKATQNSFSLSFDTNYTGKWPRGTKLVEKTSGSGVVVVGNDGHSCRVSNARYSVFLQDGNEVLDDYRCEAASLNCSIIDGRRTGG